MVQRYERNQKAKQLSANFRVGEFACKCGRCEGVLIDDVLVGYLQGIRKHFQSPVNISSGYRCRAHNEKVGGDPGSGHVEGMAADIVVKGVLPGEVAKFAESMGVQRIGLYDGFVHIGSGSKRLFWVNKNTNSVSTFGGAGAFSVELPILHRGSRGAAVKALQAHLVGLGAELDIDGSYGPATEAAVKKYQTEHDLPCHGAADRLTRMSMLGMEER